MTEVDVTAAGDPLVAELDRLTEEAFRWQQAALRVGEALASVGPEGYYTFTAAEWRDWALSVLRQREAQ